MTVTLIISTYNWHEALDLCLQSVKNQKIYPDEVIVADDGSKAETRKVVERWKTYFNIPIIHVWHEDNGFQLAKIRNKAIAKASSDYIIQIDGDIILHKNFIADHKKIATKNKFVRGSRVRLGKKLSTYFLKNQTYHISIFSSDVKNKFNGIRSTLLSKLTTKTNNSSTKMLGCNMAYWKRDALKINGYDSSMVGWGHEDEEFAARLINIGLEKIKLKNLAVAYHINHKERKRENESSHRKIINESIQSKKIEAIDGIKQITT